MTADGDDEGRVGVLVFQARAQFDADVARRHLLRQQFGAGLVRQRRQPRLQLVQRGFGQHLFDRRFAHRADLGQSHAEGRQHAGERVDDDLRHAQHVGHAAGVLAAGAAEAAHRIAADVVAALDRDRLDRLRHVVDRDGEEAVGHRAGRHRGAGLAADLLGQRGKGALDHFGVERLVAIRAEHVREVGRLDPPQHHVAVGDRQRAALAVAGRAGIGAGRFRADLEAAVLEAADRAAAGRHRVDVHHRRAHPHAGHHRFEHALVGAVVVGDVGRGAAHVEADHLAQADRLAALDGADDAAGGAGQDRVLALEAVGVGQAAVRLHEHQAHRAGFGGHPRDIVAQHRRQVGVDHGGVAAPDDLHQGADLVADRNLREAGLFGQIAQDQLVLRVAVGMHQHDRDRIDALGADLAELRQHLRLVGRGSTSPRAPMRSSISITSS